MSSAPYLKQNEKISNIVGCSPAMQALREKIIRSAHPKDPVLIIGETGTGKELVARAVYEAHPRGKFVVVDCSTLVGPLMESELFGHVRGSFTGAVQHKVGLLEEANHGTVFFDEIGELPLENQAKLLRALQEKEIRPLGSTQVKVMEWKIIAATNRDLKREVKAGRFREDLFYRLNVLKVPVPPLRERKEDIPALIEHFIHQMPTIFTVTPEVIESLMISSWVGNVRQLENCIRRMAASASGSSLDSSSIPPTVYGEIESSRDLADLGESLSGVNSKSEAISTSGESRTYECETLASAERAAILRTLEYCRGDRTAAATRLAIGRTTLYRKLKEFGLFQNGATPGKSKIKPNKDHCIANIAGEARLLECGIAHK